MFEFFCILKNKKIVPHRHLGNQINYTIKKYHHLTKEERFFIQNSLKNNMSMHAIVRKIGKSPLTVFREIKRNSDYFG
ncbi:helix-turn-helix domain-containing protein [Mycoplasma phocimorsus]|uniref:helix-turn-helix domain-containing protein n=1 Tax=Mycoplasma phocimorsus TaxID=3045839 RepID=UPI0024BF6971|nr:helix-turn-helix domain-containing protein [Mycoplasma phocimorsus]MDJ1647499.1 helix-turn-helix domain-containing protein [Mycoplasma phocimorsus]